MSIPRRARPPILREMYYADLPRVKADPGPEKDILKICIEWLNTIPNVRVWRRNVGAMKGEYKGVERFVRFGEKGEADICGIGPHGVYISIEVKAGSKQLRDDQVVWVDMIRRRGGIAFGTNSLESCQAQMRAEFERRSWTWLTRWEVA